MYRKERKILEGFITLDDREYSGSCIYTIYNTINNKLYIGKTVNYHNRYHHYKKYLDMKNVTNKRMNAYLIRSFNKYKAFEMSILEICSEKQLNDKEMFWIRFFNTGNKKYGYNLTKGGDGGASINTYKPVLVYCANSGRFLREFHSLNAASRGLDIPQSKISIVASGKRFCAKNCIFRYKLSEDFPKTIVLPKVRRTSKINIIGTNIITNQSIEWAITSSKLGKLLGVKHPSILQRLRKGSLIKFGEFIYSIAIPSDSQHDALAPTR